MRIPLEWLKEYITTTKTPKELADSFTAIGLMLDKLIDGKVLDMEHRMDRSDWLSITGCARDLAAYENIELKLPAFHSEKGKPGGNVKIEVHCPEVVRRFNTRVFKNITVKESPSWLKQRLTEYGMTPINNIVDITNYVMVELGNPMHAQDLDKFDKQEIVIRKAKEGEKITTLDGTSVLLDSQMFVLTQNNEPIVIGGIVGGAKTAVDSKTKNIVLDAGNYDQANVRQSARRLKIQNETVLRFDKFLHPTLTEAAIERATHLILELAGGEYFENTDYYPNPTPKKIMKLRYARLEKLSGMSIEKNEIKRILLALSYMLVEETGNGLEVEVPYFRTDVEVEDDIVADILRINGYHKIPSQLIASAPPKEITPKVYKFENTLKDALVTLGLHEHITDPLVSSDEIEEKQVVLENSQSSEKNALRTNLYQTLQPIVENYTKHGEKEVGIFEIGNIYKVNGAKNRFDSYQEIRTLEVIYKGEETPYGNSLKIKELYYGLLNILGIEDATVGNLSHDSFSIEVEKLLEAHKKNLRVVDELQNKITEDISITSPAGKAFGPTLEKILKADKRITKAYVLEEYFDTTKNTRSVLVRIEFPEKQITKEQAAKVVEKIKEGIVSSL